MNNIINNIDNANGDILISVVMASFNRSELLDIGLESISNNISRYKIEIIVVNDGLDDNTESVVNKYIDNLNIKYIFSGSRNEGGIISRSPSIPLNIGIKAANGEYVILTCPEIQHLNLCLDAIIEPLMINENFLTIPKYMYFDDDGNYTNDMISRVNGNLKQCNIRRDSVQMPFLMGIKKSNIYDIGGYDEDFIGYASEDNDFINRLLKIGCIYHRVDAKIVHLYHGKRCPDGLQWGNPKWAYNRNLFNERSDIIVRNIKKGWGKL